MTKRGRKPMDTQKQKEQSPFRTAEGCLYGYQENLARLESLRADLDKLSSLTIQSYKSDLRSDGGHSDPVWGYIQRGEDIREQIAALERRTEPITRLLEDLESPDVWDGSPKAAMAKILRLCYFARNSKEQVASELHMDRRRVYERRDDLVKLTIRYLGW